MCGRKTLTADMQTIIEQFAIEEWENPENYMPSYNIAPSHISPILLDNGKRIIKQMRWGLIPSWVKDDKFSSKMINARIETLLQKPSYKNLVSSNRCIVIADGYYEWKRSETQKIPYYIKNHDDQLLPMAGLYDVWKNSEGKVIPTYTIITKASQEDLAEIHGRMPVILSQEHLNTWLKAKINTSLDALNSANESKPLLEKFPVSDFVNSVRNNSEKCVERI